MGGNAFPDARRILLSEIDPTLTWLGAELAKDGTLLGNSLRGSLLGSAGKKPDSGDLDINMDDQTCDIEVVRDRLVEILGPDNVKHHKGLNQIYTLVPIKGRPSSGKVQVDFMFGNYYWQKFSYYSPKQVDPVDYPYSGGFYPYESNVSVLKGLYRTELIKALVAFCSDWVLEEKGEMIARVGPTFLHDKGTVWRYRYRPFKKGSTTERVKAFKEVSKDEFMEIFPSAIPASHSVITSPDKLVDFIFNIDSTHVLVTPDNLQTFEETWLWITRLFDKHQANSIAKIYLERLNNLKVDPPGKIYSRFKRFR